MPLHPPHLQPLLQAALVNEAQRILALARYQQRAAALPISCIVADSAGRLRRRVVCGCGGSGGGAVRCCGLQGLCSGLHTIMLTWRAWPRRCSQPGGTSRVAYTLAPGPPGCLRK